MGGSWNLGSRPRRGQGIQPFQSRFSGGTLQHIVHMCPGQIVATGHCGGIRQPYPTRRYILQRFEYAVETLGSEFRINERAGGIRRRWLPERPDWPGLPFGVSRLSSTTRFSTADSACCTWISSPRRNRSFSVTISVLTRPAGGLSQCAFHINGALEHPQAETVGLRRDQQ